MVQVLPYVPSFGERLAETIGNAATNLGQGYLQKLENQKAETFSKILTDPNSSTLQRVDAYMKLPESKKKHLGSVVSTLFAPQAQAEAQQAQFNQFLNPQGAQANNVIAQPRQQMPDQNGLAGTSPQQLPNAQGQMNQAQANGAPRQFNQRDLTSWPESQLAQLAAIEGPIGRLGEQELKRRERDYKKFTEERGHHTKGSAKAVEHAAKLRESIPKKEMALALAKDAIQSGEIGIFSLNNLSERLGVPELKTAKGAQLVTAGKENLIGNLAAVSGRAQNQWIEQRFNSMFPQIGQSEEANETIETMLEADVAIDRAYLNAFNEAEKQDIEQFGYRREDIDRRAHEIAEKQQEEIMNRTSFKMREIYERELGLSQLNKMTNKKVPKGTPLTLQNAKVMAMKFDNDFTKAINHAEKIGYTIPTNEEYDRWQ